MSAVIDFPVKPETRPYVDAFVDNPHEPLWLREVRRQALNRFAELGFPSRKNEDWRYIDLQPLAERLLLPKAAKPAVQGSVVGLYHDLSATGDRRRLVLADGRFVPELSDFESMPGVWAGSTARAITEHPDLAKAAFEIADQPFASLNQAFAADGFLLSLEAGARLDRPIEIQHLATGSGAPSLHTRNLILLGAGSHATVIESFSGEGCYWRNDVARWLLGDHASLRHITLVEEASAATHFRTVQVTLGRKARHFGQLLLLAGARLREEIAATLAGQDATFVLDGAFVVSGRDEANIVTTIDHAAPGGHTSELVKGVAAGRGHGAFQGKIIVREGAQQTDARQTSRNLILGRGAVIDTKPELEIYADDVKCAHGASVGELDEAALFYLRARGIPEAEARHMLVEGFLREAVERVEMPAVREYLLQRLARRLAALEA